MQSTAKNSSPDIDQTIKNKIDAFLDNPNIFVNGEEIHFSSFEELKASKHYTLLQSLMRVAGKTDQLKDIEAYIEERIKQRNYRSEAS